MKTPRRGITIALALVLLGCIAAGGAAWADREPLDPIKITVGKARLTSGSTAEVDFTLTAAPGYHTYSDQVIVKVKAPAGAKLAGVVMPPPKSQKDPTTGEMVSIYDGTNRFTAKLKLPAGTNVKQTDIVLQVKYTGCSADTCLLPQTVDLKPVFDENAGDTQNVLLTDTQPGTPADPQVRYNVKSLPTVVFTDPAGNEYAGERVNAAVSAGTMLDTIARVVSGKGLMEPKAGVASWLAKSGLLLTFLIVFGAGLLVTLTPCVWPMIPITTSIVLGAKKPGTGMGFALSLSYVLGLAVVYAILGFVTATAAKGLVGAALQSPWVLGGVAALFAAMALSMFGLFEMPLLNVGAGRFAGGGVAAAFLLGGVSAIVMSPCVGPVAAALLGYVARTGNAPLGMGLLFVFGLGMGAPLVAIGTFSGAMKKLPRSGGWMLEVRKIFGVLLIAFGVYFLFPLLGEQMQWIVSGAAATLVGLGFILFDVRKTLGSALGKAKLAACVIVIAAGIWAVAAAPQGVPAGEGIKWYRSFDDARTAAAQQQKPMMIDFGAKWCVACRELDKFAFSNAKVVKASDGLIAVKVDLTSASDSSRPEKLIENKTN